MKKRAEITAFFALTVLLIAALFLSMAESARMHGARLYLAQASNAAIDSLFSQYHKSLWEDYRLLGLEHYSEEQLKEEMKGFIQPYFEVKSWYPMKLSSISFQNGRLLTDGEGELFEKEVIDYMQYGILSSLFDSLRPEELLSFVKEGEGIARVSDLYDGHAKEAAKLEKTLARLNDCFKEQEKSDAEAWRALLRYDGDAMITHLEEMQEALRPVPELIGQYEAQADRLAEKLEASRGRFEEEEKAGNLQEESSAYLKEDMAQYASYVEKDGERRREISGFRARTEENDHFLEDLKEMVRSVQDYVDSYEPEDEEDTLDLEALWAPVKSAFSGYDMLSLGVQHGIADEKTESLLERISDLLKGDILTLLLPSGAVASKEAYGLKEPPSETCFSGFDDCRLPLHERVYLAEYMAGLMNYYGCDRYGEEKGARGSGRFELEYILSGEDNDHENLKRTVNRLIRLRTGANLLYLYRDSEKRSEARLLAVQITGALGFTPLVGVMSFFVLSMWALGQAVCDARDLLHGKAVSLFHTKESFYLSIEGLLGIGEGKKPPERGAEEDGLFYPDYLRIFLFFDQGSLQDYRCMDMIQYAIGKAQSDFRLDRLLYQTEAEVYAEAGHLFTETGVVKGLRGGGTGAYQLRTETAFTY